MSIVPLSQRMRDATEPEHAAPRRRTTPWIHAAWIAAVVLLIAGSWLISANWPYRHRKIMPMLEDSLASRVTIKNYHRTYFPNPGFVATGITMRRKTAPDLPPIGSVETMVVQGSWLDLVTLRNRAQLVDITGLHVVVPAIGSRENHEDFPPGSGSDFAGPQTPINRLVMHRSLFEIMRSDNSRLSFPIAELELRNLHQGEAIGWNVDMGNAQPTGHIMAHGSIGPISPKNLGSTPVWGDFTFDSVNLHDVGEISGSLNSSGHFSGTLGAIEAEATTHTPDFAVEQGRSTLVSGTIHCTVNATNGDLRIHNIDAKIGQTSIRAEGEIVGSPKVTNLDITVQRGRAEDLMRPFIHDQVPIMGPVWLRSHAYIGPPGNGFIQRMRTDGVFDAPAERTTDQQAEKSLSEFSHRAQGDKTTQSKENAGRENAGTAMNALSSLEGSVAIRDGIASTGRLRFKIAGAEADLRGTFNFHNENVHLVGTLRMDTDISHTATGFKSLLLKPLAPFFKQKRAGAVVPIAVTGGPGSYKVTQNIVHQQ